jgi:hypothetical protein
MPPEQLDAAIIYATVGDLVPLALKAVRKGGRVVCAGIHMSDIPSFPVPNSLGRAAAALGRQPHPAGWDRVPRAGPENGHRRQDDHLSASAGQQGAGGLAGRPVRRRRSARTVTTGHLADAEMIATRLVALLPSRNSAADAVPARTTNSGRALEPIFIAIAFGFAVVVLLSGLVQASNDQVAAQTGGKSAVVSSSSPPAASQPDIRR